MPERKTRKKPGERNTPKKRRAKPVIDLLPELLVKALGRHDDLIVTCEEDPSNGKRTLHLISGRFVTACMLRKLIGQAESQRDEGAVIISRKWV
jgi:hypothetical protein